MKVVVVAETIAEAGIELLRVSCRVEVAVGLGREELLARLADASGLIVRSTTAVDRPLLDAAPHLRVVGRAGIGVDNIDLPAATERGVLVVNAPQANTISAAEHTLALLLAQARNVPQADATLRSGVWDRQAFEGVELHGKTLGVIGLGRIGTLVAQRALSFGMRLLAYDPFVNAERARRLGVELAEHLDRLLAEADFITIHLPLTKETEGLVGREALAKVRSGVRIVNTSRGGIVDEDALAEAVRDGRVAGAALDVFAVEPLTESPLFGLPQVVLTPHLGASTAEAQDKAGVDVAGAVAAALRGELVLSAVNVDLGREVGEDVREYLPVAEQLGQVFTALAQGLPARITVRAEGRLGAHPVRPLLLAAVKGALQGVTTGPVSYVNVSALAEQRGIVLAQESSEESTDYLSVLQVAGTVGEREVSLAGTVGRRGPMLVEILGHEVELPISHHMLVIRNADVPGMIGRVGTFLGDEGVNIANMVVGRSPVTGEAAMMGLNVDQPITDSQVDRLRMVPGVEDARFVELAD
ncbi:MAG: phosphoglycerate dehydrogenase [Acidimicrobiia bacterium]